ncbi:digalactosyldiacylglycerol synthase 2 chloroplastic isoform X1 [Prunus yedoensis var. nudiflora]|uniref:Digalactosyldiacylglycerol synthase 2 chloroplastic isoform X1 n=1 Tax=Prunus yedoensis var. nudiflora TaxID=2094558 RepID=A0A314Z0G7_PRUYE|nr:digalactosyldiacylglycerol synthase 2 chloroplastic isoform X1 [Prunus yedoensis var. nudiflora]
MSITGLMRRTGFKSDFSVLFYPGKFSLDKRSILAVGDISERIPDEKADIAILEEPEHLTWYHHGKRWKVKFRLVVGIVHTNYLEYVRREKNGRMKAFLLKYINNWVVSIYCHKVIRLSAATQEYPKSIICNVHGVNPKFLEIGKKKLEQQQNGIQAFTKGAYYIGKMVWSKGYKELLDLLRDHQKELTGLEVDLYGTGEDSDQVQETAKRLELAVRVHPGRDHADLLFHDYKVFLNPSTTDVFPNCRTYDNGDGFVKLTRHALAEEPAQLTDAQRHELSWEAATERFLRVTELDQEVTRKLSKSPTKNFMSTSLGLSSSMEGASAYVHHVASGFEATRRIFGAIPKSLQPDEEQCKELGLPMPAVSGHAYLATEESKSSGVKG